MTIEEFHALIEGEDDVNGSMPSLSKILDIPGEELADFLLMFGHEMGQTFLSEEAVNEIAEEEGKSIAHVIAATLASIWAQGCMTGTRVVQKQLSEGMDEIEGIVEGEE